MYPILESIYAIKEPKDLVVLSAGHAGLAQYVALEKFEGHDAEKLVEDFGVHPVRDPSRGIHVSSGCRSRHGRSFSARLLSSFGRGMCRGHCVGSTRIHQKTPDA